MLKWSISSSKNGLSEDQDSSENYNIMDRPGLAAVSPSGLRFAPSFDRSAPRPFNNSAAAGQPNQYGSRAVPITIQHEPQMSQSENNPPNFNQLDSRTMPMNQSDWRSDNRSTLQQGNYGARSNLMSVNPRQGESNVIVYVTGDEDDANSNQPRPGAGSNRNYYNPPTSVEYTGRYQEAYQPSFQSQRGSVPEPMAPTNQRSALSRPGEVRADMKSSTLPFYRPQVTSSGHQTDNSSAFGTYRTPAAPASQVDCTSNDQKTKHAPVSNGPPALFQFKPDGNTNSRKETESEVDTLTNLLMQNMKAAENPDFLGVCGKCSTSVMGEDNACSALDQLFHIKCFQCQQCEALLNGQPFYAMEGQPYCETCYMNTLEKCFSCTKTISDRILRAAGKAYHPECFTCTVCHRSLEGQQLTIDPLGQIYCIPDFQKCFAPKCSVCKQCIVPKPGEVETIRIVALDKSFHVECYKCEDCGLQLSSNEGCFPLDGHILCRQCNARKIQRLTGARATDL